ncbi:MAG: ATP-binding cassette domain-containing protein, partial [Gemmatimonadetes bacterium]|nr:ATP-binding cassette domain-containing protein [Gemmatimonadota bacterium]
MTSPVGNGEPLLDLRRVSKRFPGVQALAEVDFDLRRGEVHALVGENGAGKSTLIKILTGVHRADGGSYAIDGRPAAAGDPRAAIAAGISVVYQEPKLAPNLSVAENIFFGRLPARGGRVAWRRLHEEAAAALGQVGLEVDPRRQV